MSDRRNTLVINPNSSRAERVEFDVINPLLDAGIKFRLFETPSPHAHENINALANDFRGGDRVVIASGDGVVNQALNAALMSEQDDLLLGALPLGGFNDIANAFNGSARLRDPARHFLDQTPSQDAYPLRIDIDGEFHRHAMLYATMGWTAEIAAIMDDPNLRAAVKQRRFKLPAILARATSNYYQTRKTSALPPLHSNAHDVAPGTTDIIALNGPNMARFVRSDTPYYEGTSFLRADLDVSTLPRNIPFLGSSALNLIGFSRALPGSEVVCDTLTFDKPSDIPMQLDGEVEHLQGIKTLSIAKTSQPVRVITPQY